MTLQHRREKIDRAFPSDIEDVEFMVVTGKVNVDVLARHIDDIASRYDEPVKLRENFAEFRRATES